MILNGKSDIYGGVAISTGALNKEVKASFEDCLKESLAQWEKDNKRGIWVTVDIKDSILIPILVSNGFVFHHAQEGYVKMCRWLPKTESTLPKYAHTNIGAGGLVVDKSGRILLMREKKGFYLGWKFPGGLSDPDENVFQTAEREVREETGIKADADCVLMFRQVNASQWPNVGDIYFVCAMHPKDENDLEVVACPHETADAKWFTRAELEELPLDLFHEFHRYVLDQYDCWKASARKGLYKEKFLLGRYSSDCFVVDHHLKSKK